MAILETFHTGLTVSDLDRSVAFYRDLLGLELVSQWDSEQPYLRTVVGYPDASLRIALLRIPRGSAAASGHHVELLEYRASLTPLLDLLPPREQRMLYLRFFKGMTQSEIAHKLGISQMHVSRLLAKTLATLREGLES